ncbi:MAG: DUF1853 family protein [Neisseria sp.]|nr:DUF1853 family protein [Neisseria sp.]
MNYATDALWWRLVCPEVRALASLLTAPPLWDSGCELPVKTLLGTHGFRFLLALDAQPAPLQHFLSQQKTTARLGIYAEHLLAFWLSHAPHSELPARNVKLDESGEIDFVARLDNEIYHLELSCKYLIADGKTENTLRSFDPQDTFLRKREKLMRQCAAGDSEIFRAWAASQNLGAVRSASLVRGMAFLPQDFQYELLNPYAWQGEIGLPTEIDASYRLMTLPRLAYLAPQRVRAAECFTWNEFQAQPNTLCAVLQQRADGFWHEIRRYAVMN